MPPSATASAGVVVPDARWDAPNVPSSKGEAEDPKSVARLTELWKTQPGLYGWLGTVDHKTIGERYLLTAFAFLLVGGVEALLVRLQLARSDQRLLTPEAYDQIFTMHGITMIFWYASPILSGR